MICGVILEMVSFFCGGVILLIQPELLVFYNIFTVKTVQEINILLPVEVEGKGGIALCLSIRLYAIVLPVDILYTDFLLI